MVQYSTVQQSQVQYNSSSVESTTVLEMITWILALILTIILMWILTITLTIILMGLLLS